ncbi:hypothetical protein NL676_033263 [Syzygium grande]|nr:hypothetical protein NL676_033263 [Syzygium grande]
MWQQVVQMEKNGGGEGWGGGGGGGVRWGLMRVTPSPSYVEVAVEVEQLSGFSVLMLRVAVVHGRWA